MKRQGRRERGEDRRAGLLAPAPTCPSDAAPPPCPPRSPLPTVPSPALAPTLRGGRGTGKAPVGIQNPGLWGIWHTTSTGESRPPAADVMLRAADPREQLGSRGPAGDGKQASTRRTGKHRPARMQPLSVEPSRLQLLLENAGLAGGGGQSLAGAPWGHAALPRSPPGRVACGPPPQPPQGDCPKAEDSMQLPRGLAQATAGLNSVSRTTVQVLGKGPHPTLPEGPAPRA